MFIYRITSESFDYSELNNKPWNKSVRTIKCELVIGQKTEHVSSLPRGI